MAPIRGFQDRWNFREGFPFNMVSITEASQRAKKLRDLIDKYRHSRLVLDKPLVAESVEDSLKKELFDLEQKYPQIVTPDSPTQRVGSRPLEKFEKVKHPQPMLSFNDAFRGEDMEDWKTRLERIDPKAIEKGLYSELKIDGLAIELIYEKGYLKYGLTRGDGIIGEDVTGNLKTIEAIPLKLETENYKLPTELVVRGEVFLNKKDFEKINKELQKRGVKAYANPRNLAAGSVRQLDPKITAQRKLDSFAYAIVTDLGQKTHQEEHRILKALGFRTNPHNKFLKDLDEVEKFRVYWEKARDKLEYEIDGIVVALNDNRMFEKLGVVGKAPRGAIAYKFSPKEATTKIKDIIVSVGRTGTLTPIAVLEPVNVGGVTVSRATLHNEDEIKRLEVKIGDTVVVGRAGDVIPDIRKVLKELRTGKEKEFYMPKTCPVCKSKVERVPGEAAHRCTNLNCPAIKREAIYHFVSKSAMDISGVGPKIIDQLMEAGLIKDAPDLYILKKEDVLNLPRFADKSAENLINSIQNKKKVSLDKFIYSLGIRHVGQETAFDLAKNFGSLKNIKNAVLEDLEKVPDIGKVVARSIYNWFKSRYNLDLIDRFKKRGLNITKSEIVKSVKFKGRKFVFTGTMESLSRERAQQIVRELGGDVSSDISKETTYLVAGSEPGSKYERAKRLGIKILSEKEFLNIIK